MMNGTDELEDWTSEELSSMCTPQCHDDISELSIAMKQSCSHETLHLRTGDVTLADHAELLVYRSRQMCLQHDGDEEDFCYFASTRYVWLEVKFSNIID